MPAEIVWAKEEDVADILSFIRELARFERLEHEVVGDTTVLRESLFGPKPRAEVIFIEEAGVRVGFALFFHNFSTFLGLPGLYLEDLYVKPEHRGRGYGKLMLSFLAKLALERGCGRVEWWVLDWNKPAVEFYKSLGAEAMSDWTVHRLTGKSLKTLAET